jgi:hypothetical protein
MFFFEQIKYLLLRETLLVWVRSLYNQCMVGTTTNKQDQDPNKSISEWVDKSGKYVYHKAYVFAFINASNVPYVVIREDLLG